MFVNWRAEPDSRFKYEPNDIFDVKIAKTTETESQRYGANFYCKCNEKCGHFVHEVGVLGRDPDYYMGFRANSAEQLMEVACRVNGNPDNRENITTTIYQFKPRDPQIILPNISQLKIERWLYTERFIPEPYDNGQINYIQPLVLRE
jgi:hypothetical protein